MSAIPGKDLLETLPKGWANAVVSLRRGKRIEILDLRAGMQVHYPREPMVRIALKCALLFLALPIYFLLYTAVHLIRLPVVTLVNGSPTAFGKQIWTLARIPFYWIALEFAALYGIFKPLEGRAWFADLESRLHGGKSRYKDVLRYEKEDEQYLELFWKALSFEEDPHTIFVGFCMQPYGKAGDEYVLDRTVKIVQNSLDV